MYQVYVEFWHLLTHPMLWRNIRVRVVLAEGQTMTLAGATHLVAGGTKPWGEDGQVKFTNDVK